VQVVRKVDAAGVITTVAGNGDPGFSGDGGAATEASLDQPTGLAFDSEGNLLIADSSNHAVRRVDLADGTISTLAGNGTEGYGGVGEAAAAALLSFPSALAVDGSGNILVVDAGNNKLRRIDPQGVISSLATAPAGQGIAFDPATGSVYLASTGGYSVRELQCP
jgi:DNA-binding beta-propeller fold protein YncE